MKWITLRRIVQFGLLLLFLAPVMGFTLVLGTLISASVLGIVLADPLAGLEILSASKSIYLPLVIAVILMIAFSAILGRVYCGWVCPINTTLELVDKHRPANSKTFSRSIKYKILIIVLLLSLLTSLPVYELINPAGILIRNIFFGFGPEFSIVMGIVAFELFISKRGWCRYFCPQGATYSLIGRFSPVRVRLSDVECKECHNCEQKCPMGIPVSDFLAKGKEISDKECTRCGECIDACKAKALYIGWGRKY